MFAMEFKELFQLAKGNSSLAKRKSKKLHGDEDKDSNVSSSDVTQYIEKRKREKESQLKAEQDAKRKRIEARLNASIGKKDKPKAAVVEPPKSKPKPKAETSQPKKIKSEIKKEKKKEGGHRKEDKAKEKQKHVERPKNDVKLDKHKNEHRKERERTEKPKNKVKKRQSENSGLSVMDLMKLAKSNSEVPGSGAVKKKEMQQKLAAKKKVEEQPYDPDRYLKIKRKHKDVPQAKPPPAKQSRLDINNKITDKRKLAPPDSSKRRDDRKAHKPPPPRIASKDICRSEIVDRKTPKHGLLVETVSVSKHETSRGIHGQNGKVRNVPRQKMTKHNGGGIPAQHRGGGGGGGGIAAQNKGYSKNVQDTKTKRKAEDYEDEFEREEKELAKQRKLFEMRRRTGNNHLQVEDVFDEDDLDYDLDEEDDDDGDFIDDTGGAGNYSSYIRQITGYDRRRFEDSDSDLDNMESSYSQIEKEEARSARIAKIEDEYERMKEEEELAKIEERKKKKK